MLPFLILISFPFFEPLTPADHTQSAQTTRLHGGPVDLAARGSISTFDETNAIRRVLGDQVTAWNRGAIEEFMDTYWQSEELTFSAGGETTRGWQATLDRYRQRYSDSRAMGRLRFDELEISMLCDDAALVLGRWYLSREEEDREGNFSLVMRKLDDQWLIIHDHSSLSPPGE